MLKKQPQANQEYYPLKIKQNCPLNLMNIVGTFSSKLFTHHKDLFTKLDVEAVLILKGSGNLEAIHILKKLADSYLDEGFLLVKKNGSKSIKAN